MKQFAAGGVVIKKERGIPKILLIKDSYGHWTWPKGHMEKKETLEETALREIAEETGQKKTEIVKKIGEQKYIFTLRGKKISKIVYIFLIKAQAREKLVVQASEIEKAKWFRAEEALEKIEYKGSRALLKKGIEAFKRKYC